MTVAVAAAPPTVSNPAPLTTTLAPPPPFKIDMAFEPKPKMATQNALLYLLLN